MQGQMIPTDNYYLVQFEGPIEAAWKEALNQAGAQIFDYIPQFVFIVKMDTATRTNVEKMEMIRWVGPYRPAYRVSPHLVELASTESSGPLHLTVVVLRGEDIDAIMDQLSGLGGRVLEVIQSQWKSKIQMQIAPSRVSAIARIPGVEWVEPSPQWELANDKADDILGVREVWDTHGLYGAGQIIAVCDSGLDQGSAFPANLHDDFEDGLGQSRVVAIYDVAGDGDPRDHRYPHGTYVAGSVLGNGLHSGSNPGAHSYPSGCIAGMAPEASLVFQAANHNGQPSNRLSLPGDLNALFEQARSDGAHIHTNSWGSEAHGTYTSYSQDVDEFVWDHRDFVILFAAGNYASDSDQDGVVDLGSVAAPATAKNCIAVGATEGDRPDGGGADLQWGMEGWFPAEPLASDHISDDPGGMAAFSGRGPTADGRIKPDLVAPGTNVLSVRSTAIPTSTDVLWGNYTSNPYYAWGGGTSASTPLVAGAAALVREYYVIQGLSPSAALVKATLINGATDLSPGQYGTGVHQEIPDPPRPNNVQGWGRVNLQDSLFPPAPGELHYVDDANGLETGQTLTYTFQMVDSGLPLHVTLAWSDYPGSPAAGGGLVNDLDLVITGPDQLNYSPPTDRSNNVEGVDIVSPPLGPYTICVKGYNVPQGPQPFSLVVTGAGEPIRGSILINEDDEFANSTGVTLALSAWDESGVAEMSLSNRADFAGSTWERFATKRSWTLTPENGVQAVHVKFKDGLGNASDAYSDTIFLDTTPPSSMLEAPGGGALLDDLAVIRGQTSDPEPSSGLAEVELQVTDGVHYLRDDGSWASTPGWFAPGGGVAPVWTHDTANVAWSDGTYTLTVRARDRAGNVEAPATTLAFTVDATLPEVAVISPNGGEAWSANSEQTIHWLASDLHLTSYPITLSYSLDGGGSWALIAAGVANGNMLVWETPLTTTLQGLVKVEAVDEVGFTGSDISDDVFAIFTPDAAWSRVYLPVVVRAMHPSAQEP
jgi:subtilisin family serine protease